MRFDEIIGNFPVRPVAWLMRFLIQPLSPSTRGPTDRVTQAAAEIITNPCPARERLTAGLYQPGIDADDGVALVKRAFARTVAVQPIRDRMRAARLRDIDHALDAGTINAEEAAQLQAAAEAVSAAIAVDDFSPQELASRGAARNGGVPSQAKAHRPAAE
jgi:acyl-CoA dehydrogenase